MDHIGMDVHKRESQICILTPAGELIEGFQLPFATPKGVLDGHLIRAYTPVVPRTPTSAASERTA